MLIVDSQVHIWAANTPDRPWPARHAPHKTEPITKDVLLSEMATAGVDRVVLVPPSFEGDRNDIVLAAAQAHPDRFVAMGRIDPEAPAAREQIRTWLKQTGMLGLRFTFHRPEQRPLLTEGRVDWLWSEAEKASVPIMMFLLHSDMQYVDRIAERHPKLQLVIDHLGITKGKGEAAFLQFDKLLALSKRPNIAVKASCAPSYNTSDIYPYRRLHPYLRSVYDAFGPKRIFWGSDLSLLPCSYRQCVTMFTEEMPFLSSADLEWIMGRGICEWIGWKAWRARRYPTRPLAS